MDPPVSVIAMMSGTDFAVPRALDLSRTTKVSSKQASV